jgi:hypothetical protein
MRKLICILNVMAERRQNLEPSDPGHNEIILCHHPAPFIARSGLQAEMIAWFAETFDEASGQAYDAAPEKLRQMVIPARSSLVINIKPDLIYDSHTGSGQPSRQANRLSGFVGRHNLPAQILDDTPGLLYHRGI